MSGDLGVCSDIQRCIKRDDERGLQGEIDHIRVHPDQFEQFFRSYAVLHDETAAEELMAQVQEEEEVDGQPARVVENAILQVHDKYGNWRRNQSFRVVFTKAGLGLHRQATMTKDGQIVGHDHDA